MINLGGDLRFIGWDANAQIQADRYDQLTALAAGFGGKQMDESERYPRPGRDKTDAPEPGLYAPTIADFNIGAFMGELTK